jgi:hypothetical protein
VKSMTTKKVVFGDIEGQNFFPKLLCDTLEFLNFHLNYGTISIWELFWDWTKMCKNIRYNDHKVLRMWYKDYKVQNSFVHQTKKDKTSWCNDQKVQKFVESKNENSLRQILYFLVLYQSKLCTRRSMYEELICTNLYSPNN